MWINEPSRVFVARGGKHELTSLFLTAEQVRGLVERMLSTSGRRLDISLPFVDLNREVFYREGDVELDDRQTRRLVADYLAGEELANVRIRTDGDQVHVRIERSVELAFAPPGWASRTTIVAEATSQLRLGG